MKNTLIRLSILFFAFLSSSFNLHYKNCDESSVNECRKIELEKKENSHKNDVDKISLG
jgi:hypothetical protein